MRSSTLSSGHHELSSLSSLLDSTVRDLLLSSSLSSWNSESSSSSPLLELRLLEPLASSMPWDCYHHFVKDFIGNNVRAELGRFDKPTYFGHTLLTFISIQVWASIISWKKQSNVELECKPNAFGWQLSIQMKILTHLTLRNWVFDWSESLRSPVNLKLCTSSNVWVCKCSASNKMEVRMSEYLQKADNMATICTWFYSGHVASCCGSERSKSAHGASWLLSTSNSSKQLQRSKYFNASSQIGFMNCSISSSLLAALVSVYLDELNTWVQAEPNALVKKLLANTLQYAHTIILDSTIQCKCFNMLLRRVHLFVLSHLISRKQEVSMNMLLGIPTMGITSTFAILSFFMDVLVKLHSKQDSVENRDTPLKLLSVIVGSIV